VCSVLGAKIHGWFKNQRTAVGKLYKKKSGQAAKAMTKRQQWQEKSFAFLKEAIEPRTYTKDTASVSIANIQFHIYVLQCFIIITLASCICLLPLTSCIVFLHFDILGVVFCLQVRSRSEDEDDGAGSSVSASTSAARGRSDLPTTKSRPPAKKAKNLEDAMLAYLSRPEPSTSTSRPPQAELMDPTDERAAFATWFSSRLHRVPDGRLVLFID